MREPIPSKGCPVKEERYYEFLTHLRLHLRSYLTSSVADQACELAMGLGGGGSREAQKYNNKPPDKGSFPLDHDGVL